MYTSIRGSMLFRGRRHRYDQGSHLEREIFLFFIFLTKNIFFFFSSNGYMVEIPRYVIWRHVVKGCLLLSMKIWVPSGCCSSTPSLHNYYYYFKKI